MLRYLVTGGAGFIGSHLVEALIAGKHEVVVLDNLSTGRRENLVDCEGWELCEGSILDKNILRSAVSGCDVVYHLAALPSVRRSLEDPASTHDVCATGTLNVLAAAKQARVRRVIFAASSSAYGGADGRPRQESDPVKPLSPYAAAKLAGEHYCVSYFAAFGLPTVRLRFFNVFGPRQDPSNPYAGVIALFLAAMTKGQSPRVFGDGCQARDFTYVANAVQALLKSSSAPAAPGNVYNVGTQRCIMINELISSLNALLDCDIQPIYEAARPGEVNKSQADITLAARDLGYLPEITFLEGLRRTLDWYLARPANAPRAELTRYWESRVDGQLEKAGQAPEAPEGGITCRNPIPG